MAGVPQRVRVRVSLALDVDAWSWITETGVDPTAAAVRKDVQDYVRNALQQGGGLADLWEVQ